MFKILSTLAAALMLAMPGAYSQDQGVFSGGFEGNFNIFMRDSLIGAANTPQYDKQITGGEAWLSLNYAYKGFDVGLRFDMFNNSNLLDPTGSYTGSGIGIWFIRKKVNKLGIEVIVKGASIDGYLSLGSEESPVSLSPGIGVVNRTLSDEAIGNVIAEVRNYIGDDRFLPEYNVYLASIYNTLAYKGFTWYTEAAFKSDDTFFDPEASRITGPNSSAKGRFVKDGGSVFYNSLSYGAGKLGVTFEVKRTERFNFRVDPGLQLVRGLVNWLPPMNRFNTYRLTGNLLLGCNDKSTTRKYTRLSRE